jgi:predicted transcriptional regulator
MQFQGSWEKKDEGKQRPSAEYSLERAVEAPVEAMYINLSNFPNCKL